ncbi:unnamed protein product [Caenorhabditis angaria]|uniref:Uncharacterized protein n=1 Tax=Caenorhabditis angaria TaxID=860376 RepID=A0A9P1IAU7_9PELO|nr:unnamed protein product [Caenorhabditis angaria]
MTSSDSRRLSSDPRGNFLLEQPDEAGLRRSARTRIEPLRPWLGEYAVYANSPLGSKSVDSAIILKKQYKERGISVVSETQTEKCIFQMSSICNSPPGRHFKPDSTLELSLVNIQPLVDGETETSEELEDPRKSFYESLIMPNKSIQAIVEGKANDVKMIEKLIASNSKLPEKLAIIRGLKSAN